MWKPENWPLSLLITARGEQALVMLETSAGVKTADNWWAKQPYNNPGQTQNQGYVQAHPNIHPDLWSAAAWTWGEVGPFDMNYFIC